MSTPTQTSAVSGLINSIARIRVGVIGVGNWARNGPLRVLAMLPHYEIVAVYSQRPAAAQEVATQYGIKTVAASVQDLVSHPDIDLVLVQTIGPQNEKNIRAAIAAGNDVYCEWPVTPKAETTAELVKLAKLAGVQTIVGTQRRFSPAFRYAKDLIADGYVGRVRSVRMAASVKTFGQTRAQAIRWSTVPENFMGVTSIHGAHMMEPLFAVVGRPTEISALSVNQWPVVTIAETGEKISTSVADQLMMSGLLANGAVFSIHVEGGKHNGTGVRIAITGDEGDLSITNTAVFAGPHEEYRVAGARKGGAAIAPLPVPESYLWLPPSDLPVAVVELAYLFEGHARDLANGPCTVPGFEDALFLQRLLLQAEVSWTTGLRATVPQ